MFPDCIRKSSFPGHIGVKKGHPLIQTGAASKQQLSPSHRFVFVQSNR